jgi:zinc protease
MIIPHSAVALAMVTGASLIGLRATTERGDAPRSTASVADDTTLLSYTVDSVRVIQRLTPTTEVVAVNIYLLGGVRQLTPTTQGIEAMLLGASKFGTRSFPDSALRRAWAMTGSSAESELTSDWSMLGFRGVGAEFDRSWDIIAERLVRPTFPSSGVTTARDRLVASLRQARSSPDGEIGSVADSVTFAGHAYGLSPYGTEQTLAALDSAALAAYVRAHVQRSRMLVVVVGGVTRAMVEAAIRRNISTAPLGTYQWTAPAPVAPHGSTVTLIPRRSATNYVIGVFDGPPETSDDFPSFRAATNYLGSMITEAVREKRGLSYAASASVYDRALVTGVIYVSTPRPDTVVKLVQRQIRTLTDPDSMPSGFSFTTDKNALQFLFRRSSSAVQADALAHAQILQGDYRLADNVPRRLRSITTGSMRMAAVKYMKNIRFIYAGDTTLVKRATFSAMK